MNVRVGPNNCGNVLGFLRVEFEIVSEIVNIEIIAVAGSIRDLRRLNRGPLS